MMYCMFAFNLNYTCSVSKCSFATAFRDVLELTLHLSVNEQNTSNREMNHKMIPMSSAQEELRLQVNIGVELSWRTEGKNTDICTMFPGSDHCRMLLDFA